MLLSTYTARWFAVAVLVVAAAGRKHTYGVNVAAALAGVGGLGLAVWEANRLAQGADGSDWAFVAGGTVVFCLSVAQIMRGARGAAWDPVRLAAAQLFIGVIALWIYYAINGRALDYRNVHSETIVDFLRSGLPFMALALAAVGLGINRTGSEALKRLGVGLPAWWQVPLALLVAQLFLLAAHPINVLTRELMPAQYHAIGLVTYYSYAAEPSWVYLAFAVIAGVSEELLFRGAVLPRLGIVAAALVFALGHVQYGITPILGGVFVHGLVYGMLRRYANTTTSMIAHAAYDFGAYVSVVPVAHFAMAAVLAAALVLPAFMHRVAIWTLLRNGLRDDWAGFRAQFRSAGFLDEPA